MREVGKEQRHADHRVTAIMDGRVDDTSVAFSSDQRAGLTHLSGDVDLTDSRGMIFSAIFLGHVPQGAAGR